MGYNMGYDMGYDIGYMTCEIIDVTNQRPRQRDSAGVACVASYASLRTLAGCRLSLRREPWPSRRCARRFFKKPKGRRRCSAPQARARAV